MFGKLRLNQDFSGQAPAPGAAGDLRDGLRQALGGAKIAGEQPLIGIQDHHQADLGEVVALGEHLRADQNSRLAAVHAVEHGLTAPRADAVSRSSRASGASGNNRAKVSSTRSVP